MSFVRQLKDNVLGRIIALNIALAARELAFKEGGNSDRLGIRRTGKFLMVLEHLFPHEVIDLQHE